MNNSLFSSTINEIHFMENNPTICKLESEAKKELLKQTIINIEKTLIIQNAEGKMELRFDIPEEIDIMDRARIIRQLQDRFPTQRIYWDSWGSIMEDFIWKLLKKEDIILSGMCKFKIKLHEN